MPLVRLPDHFHDSSYQPARGPVLLVTCMDLRLLNEVTQFMDHDGLNNRYDHVILAGAALGALGGGRKDHKHWKRTFFDHLKVAHKLHHIKDVYIIEHRDCGAYREFLGCDGDFHNGCARAERRCHRKYARILAKKIKRWGEKHDAPLDVHSFLMDLRGRVKKL
jgi:carbonic anhydrase